MSEATVKVIGAEKVAVNLKALEERIRKNLRDAVYGLGAEVQRDVKDGYLKGPRPERLGRVTGNLSRSVNLASTGSNETTARATVGTNSIYGAAWELGHVKNWGGHIEAARPFLMPALLGKQARIQQRIAAVVSGAVNG
jgi:phage gpG-like protein